MILTVRREIAAHAFLVKSPSTGLGCPEPVEGRIACFQRMFNGQFQGEDQGRPCVRHIHAYNRCPRHQGCLTSSLLLFSCQVADDFLGTSFLRIFNRGIGGTLILDGPSERHDSIPNCDVNEIAVDVRT